MAMVFADRVKETTTTTGTGTLDLGGAAVGFQSFVAGIGNTNECSYCITDGTYWEVGEGTVTDASPDTLSRDTILASSNSDAAVNWTSGTKDVFVVYPAGVVAVTSYTNSTNNRILTSVDSTTVNGEANLTFDGSVLAATGNITATGTVEPAGDTAASDNAAIGYTSAEGLILTGQGSTNDVTIKNDADAEVMGVLTGTTTAAFTGQVTGTGFTGTLDGILGSGTPAAATVTTIDASGVATATTFEPDGDTAAGDNAAIGYTSAEGLILTGQGSTNDVTIKNDADGTVISIPTGTTNVTIAGDLTISGDDLTMATNTSGAALIADGTNFNPVVISGDVSINTSGVAAIGSAVIVEADIADNAVTLAKMASGTDGNIISYDASGNPVAIATGNDGQVLTSTGAGSPPAFENAAGGGAWNLLETQNPSNAATVNMVTTIDSTYSRYYIEITDVVPATDGVQFMARVSDDGGSSWKSGASDYEYRTTQWDNGADAEVVTRATGDSAFRLTTDTTNKDMGSDGGKGGTFTVTLSNPANTSLQQLVMWQGQWDTPSGSGTANSFGGGNYSTAEAIDGIQFLMSSGNVESGKFSLYGLSM